jgi:thiol:disulfide interchange protein DsbD
MKKKKTKIVAGFLTGALVVAAFVANIASATRHTATAVAVGSEAQTSIKWFNSVEPALARAKETGKPVMIDFYATWCVPCKMLDTSTYRNRDVVNESEHWIMVRIDVDENQELATRYRVQSVPTIVLLSSDGKEKERKVGFVEAVSMEGAMTAFRQRDT